LDITHHQLAQPAPHERAFRKPGSSGGLLGLLWCLAGALAVLPQRAAAEEAPRPLEFEVRPSGTVVETPDEALDRRLRQREYLFRSICRHCSRGDRFGSDTPFRPFEALAAPAPLPGRD
jgi:hypothetical protein